MRILDQREISPLGEQRLFGNVPDPGPGRVTPIYCEITNKHGTGYCDRNPRANGRCYIQVYAQFEMRGLGIVRKINGYFQAEQAFINKDKHTGMIVRLMAPESYFPRKLKGRR